MPKIQFIGPELQRRHVYLKISRQMQSLRKREPIKSTFFQTNHLLMKRKHGSMSSFHSKRMLKTLNFVNFSQKLSRIKYCDSKSNCKLLFRFDWDQSNKMHTDKLIWQKVNKCNLNLFQESFSKRSIELHCERFVLIPSKLFICFGLSLRNRCAG